jgi:GH24 family phage-related lysozyme (muramidase)
MDNEEIKQLIADAWGTNPLAKNYPLEGCQQIALQEGLEQEAYQDSYGNWTIGIGHKGAFPGEVWTVQQCVQTYFQDLRDIAVDPLDDALPWAKSKMGVIRWWVFVNMTYNMGIGAFLEFDETITAAKVGDWDGVALGMEQSEWYGQVGQRSIELCQQMRTGEWILPS